MLVGVSLPAAAFMTAGGLEERLVPNRADTGLYASLHYFTASDWTAIRDISGDWTRRYAPRDGRNMALAFLRAETGVRHGAWRIGYQYRHEAIIDTSRDTLDLLYLQKNNLPIPAGRNFEVSLDAEMFEVEGPRLQHSFEFGAAGTSRLRALLGLSLLKGSRMRSGAVKGTAAQTSPGTYAFDLEWSDFYSRKTYPFLTPGSPSGSGHALDAAFEFQWNDDNHIAISVIDLDSRMTWRDVPSTEARAQSATATRDAQGHIVYLPAVAGQNRRQAHVQKFDPKLQIRYARETGPLTMAAGVLVIRGMPMPQLSLGYRMGEHWRLALGHEFRFGSTSVVLRYRALSIALSADSTKLDHARALGFSAQLVWPL